MISPNDLWTWMTPRATTIAWTEVGRGDPGRAELEAFVNAAFARKHGARVRSFMPTLLVSRDANGPAGVIGFRGAEDEPLYLEQYLEAPVEQVLAHYLGHPVSRARIVEVGHLASRNCTGAARMAAALPRYLLKRNYEWIVFTGTRTVQGILRRLGAPLHELACATAECVATARDDWGGYYRNDPRVYAGSLADARRIPAFHAGV